MYEEIILTLIIIYTFYIIFYNDNRVEVDAFNNKKYKVRPGTAELQKRKADFLAVLDNKATKIVNDMYNENYPNEKVSKRLYDRFKNSSINETPPNDSGAAYTINKGPISICIEKKNGSFHDQDDAFFVILHELAHIMSVSYGHGEEFQENFDYIVKYAVKNGLWTDKNYQDKSSNYCGVDITSSPCDNEQCTKSSLDNFFQESLLDN